MMHMGIYENHAFLIKDINKVLNNFTCGECMARFTRADNLKRHAPRCTNRGFRMKDGVMYTYEQHKLGLSAYYDKRWVLEDGIHTEPIEFHTPN